MKTRTRNALVMAGGLAVIVAGLVWVGGQRAELDLRSRALDAVPNGALLVVTADLEALRASPVGGPFLREGREIPGLGKVQEVCGFDPLDAIREIALSIPAAGDEGDFGLVAAGDVQEEALIACASKIIEAKGGRPVVTTIGTFRTVRDASLTATGGEIAVRKGGPVLLGAGAYLRAMIDAADGRGPTIRSSVAHSNLAREVNRAALRVTVVLTPEQRKTIDAELAGPGSAASGPRGSAIVAGALGVELGPTVSIHGVLLCEGADACRELADALRRTKDARAGEIATRMMGFGDVLARMTIEPVGEQIHVRVGVPAEEVAKLVERLIVLRGMRHPLPRGTAAPLPEGSVSPGSPPGSPLPAPDEIIPADPKPADAGGPKPRRPGDVRKPPPSP